MSRAQHILGDLQLAIMRVLWERGEATAAEVHEALLEERGLAPTTIATMLRKMEDKGVVRHVTRGRFFVYLPKVDAADVHRSMVGDFVDRLFSGRPIELVSHLLAEGEIDADELEELRAQLNAARKGRKRGR